MKKVLFALKKRLIEQYIYKKILNFKRKIFLRFFLVLKFNLKEISSEWKNRLKWWECIIKIPYRSEGLQGRMQTSKNQTKYIQTGRTFGSLTSAHVPCFLDLKSSSYISMKWRRYSILILMSTKLLNSMDTY